MKIWPRAALAERPKLPTPSSPLPPKATGCSELERSRSSHVQARRPGRVRHAPGAFRLAGASPTARLVACSVCTVFFWKFSQKFSVRHNRSVGTPSSRTDLADPSDPPEAGPTDALQSKNEIWTIGDPPKTVHLNPSSWTVHGVQHLRRALVQTPLPAPRLTLEPPDTF